MLTLKRLFLTLLLFAVLVISVFFALSNTIAVPLNLLVIKLSEQSLAVWVLSAFVIGGLVGMLISSGLYFSAKKSEFSYRKKLKLANEELYKLRSSAYKA